MRRKLTFTIIILATFILLVACNNNDDTETTDNSQTESENVIDGEDLEQLEPDLDNIPEIVAEVNGKEITRAMFERTYLSQFEQAMQNAQITGGVTQESIDKQVIAENMIDLELLMQEAERRNFEATDQEVDAYLLEIAETSQFESVDLLLETYEEQGLTEVQIREEVASDIKLNHLFEDETKGVTASDQQIEELYDEFLIMYEELDEIEDDEIPSIDDLRSDLEELVLFNEENELILNLIDKLKNDAKIDIYL